MCEVVKVKMEWVAPYWVLKPLNAAGKIVSSKVCWTKDRIQAEIECDQLLKRK